VKDTRAALLEHFREGHFVHPAALFAADGAGLAEWLAKSAVTGAEDDDTDAEGVAGEDQALKGDDFEESYREAAE
jgi:ParB family chromosome partitioning protein